MLSSPDRDDDLLRERLLALHDTWPGDPADDDPMRATRRAAAAQHGEAPTMPGPLSVLRHWGRRILVRLGAGTAGLPLPPTAEPAHPAAPAHEPAPAPAPADQDPSGDST